MMRIKNIGETRTRLFIRILRFLATKLREDTHGGIEKFNATEVLFPCALVGCFAPVSTATQPTSRKSRLSLENRWRHSREQATTVPGIPPQAARLPAPRLPQER